MLNQTSPTFAADLKQLIDSLNPTVLFDYLGGSVPAQVFTAMPYGSLLVVVGVLTQEPIPINSGNLLFTNKKAEALLLPTWFQTLSHEEKEKALKEVGDDLSSGGKIFGSNIYKELPLSDYQQAMELSKTNATEGKVVLHCW